MKTLKWILTLTVLSAIATSCGQNNSNRKKATDTDISPEAAALIQQTSSTTTFDALMAQGILTQESSLDYSDKKLIMYAYMTSNKTFVGNIYYGSSINPYKGENLSLKFEYSAGATYSFVQINSSRGSLYESYTPTMASEVNLGNGRKIKLHSNSKCLIFVNTLDNYNAVVCEQ